MVTKSIIEVVLISIHNLCFAHKEEKNHNIKKHQHFIFTHLCKIEILPFLFKTLSLQVTTFVNLLINFTNSQNPDQVLQNIKPNLDANCLDTLMVFLKDFFEKS